MKRQPSPLTRIRTFHGIVLGSLLGASLLGLSASSVTAKDARNEDKTMRLEKVVAIAREAHPTMSVINTFEETVDGKPVDKVFYILPENKEMRLITIDSHTGKIVEDKKYSLPEKQKSIPLETLLGDLRAKHDITKIIRTRLAQRDGRDVRIIIYLDKLKQQRLMTVDTKTGEVLSDKARKLT